MADELREDDPFDEGGEPAEENLISEAMVKKATYHIHKLAEQRKQDFKAIQKKCKKLFAYENLAKVSMDDGHRIIDKLVELTGGEEESKPGIPQGPTKPTGDGISAAEVAAIQAKEKEREKEINAPQLPIKPGDGLPTKGWPTKQEERPKKTPSIKEEELGAEIGKLAEMLQICVGFSRDIVKEEIGKDNITEGTQAILIKSFAATLYIDASKRGLGR